MEISLEKRLYFNRRMWEKPFKALFHESKITYYRKPSIPGYIT